MRRKIVLSILRTSSSSKEEAEAHGEHPEEEEGGIEEGEWEEDGEATGEEEEGVETSKPTLPLMR
jgi:hypothetical protein